MAVRAVRARLACSAALFVCFVACLCWSAVCIAGNGADGGKLLVVAVACMCASLVSSFGLLLADLALSVPGRALGPVSAIRTIHVGPMGPNGPIGPIGPIGPVGPNGQAGPMGHTGHVGPDGPMGISHALFRRATVSHDSYVAIAVDTSSPASPTSAASPKVWVFEPSSPYSRLAE